MSGIIQDAIIQDAIQDAIIQLDFQMTITF